MEFAFCVLVILVWGFIDSQKSKKNLRENSKKWYSGKNKYK
jgi:hypothetical protein